jgi:hypothetical protein
MALRWPNVLDEGTVTWTPDRLQPSEHEREEAPVKMTTTFQTGGFVLPSCTVAGPRERRSAGSAVAVAPRSLVTVRGSAATTGSDSVDVPTPVLVRLGGANG